MISKELLEILACPLCKSELRLEGERLFCTLGGCGCIYQIRDDIPVMLIDEAQRPCPKCRKQRKWEPARDAIVCESCGTAFQYQRGTKKG